MNLEFNIQVCCSGLVLSQICGVGAGKCHHHLHVGQLHLARRFSKSKFTLNLFLILGSIDTL